MADSKLIDLTADATPTGDDLLYVLNDPAGTPVDRKVTITNLATVLAALTAFTNTFEAKDATLTALAGQDWAANAVPVGSGDNTLSQVAVAVNKFLARASTGNYVAKDITDFILTLLDDPDAATALATLGAVPAGGTTVAIGASATASGADSISIGENSDATASGAVAVGSDAQATVAASVAIGDGANVSAGVQGIAIGLNSSAAANNTIGIGAAVQATATNGIAIGVLSAATHAGGVAIGADNTSTGAATGAVNDFVLGTALHNVKIPGTLTVTGAVDFTDLFTAIPDAAGGVVVDIEGRAALNNLLAQLRAANWMAV